MSSSANVEKLPPIRDYFKRWPKLYGFIALVFGPLLFTGLGPRGFLKRYGSTGLCLDLGSGPKRIHPNIRTVDMVAYPGIDIVADITNLPMAEASVDRIVCENVLEHVINPQAVANEIQRVLKPGGAVYISAPWLYPFHPAPDDYQRLTDSGMRELLGDLEIVDFGVRCGPFSALTAWACYVIGSTFSFGSTYLYWVMTNIALFVTFPIKLLDIGGQYLPRATDFSAILFWVARKKNT